MAAKKEKPKTARAVHANKAVEARYRKTLEALIKEMSESTEYWVSAQYRKAEPVMAEDALPASEMAERLKKVGKRWIRRWNALADDIARRFAAGSIKSTDNSFQAALRDAGWAVEFKMTKAMRDVANAAVVENVGLIKSIPQQYFQEIEGIVMRGYSQGRDLATITSELQARYGVTKRRAILISRDQNNKLTAATTQARRLELGIKEALWQHSHSGKEPRKSHVAADGKKFEIAKGCLIDGKWILPGTEINCRCSSKSVLPF